MVTMCWSLASKLLPLRPSSTSCSKLFWTGAAAVLLRALDGARQAEELDQVALQLQRVGQDGADLLAQRLRQLGRPFGDERLRGGDDHLAGAHLQRQDPEAARVGAGHHVADAREVDPQRIDVAVLHLRAGRRATGTARPGRARHAAARPTCSLRSAITTSGWRSAVERLASRDKVAAVSASTRPSATRPLSSSATSSGLPGAAHARDLPDRLRARGAAARDAGLGGSHRSLPWHQHSSRPAAGRRSADGRSADRGQPVRLVAPARRRQAKPAHRSGGASGRRNGRRPALRQPWVAPPYSLKRSRLPKGSITSSVSAPHGACSMPGRRYG